LGVALTVAAGIAALAWAPRAEAAYIITIQEIGSDLVVNGSGSLNLSALSPFAVGSAAPAIGSAAGTIGVGTNAGSNATFYVGITGPASFGTGGYFFASTSTGSIVTTVGEIPGVIGVPNGYVSGTAMASSNTYVGQSLASVGIAPNTYVWSWGSQGNGTADTLTLQITAGQDVPEPATALLLAAPLGTLLMRRRRERKHVARS